jgi:hypothetical protein
MTLIYESDSDRDLSQSEITFSVLARSIRLRMSHRCEGEPVAWRNARAK